MGRRVSCAAIVLLALALVAPGTSAAPPDADRARPGPGAAGAGDPYFPKAGNGGYDVGHYTLRLTYRPRTDRLWGRATIDARATKDLTRFNLDLSGMRVKGVWVDGRRADWSRRGAELRVEPKRVLRRGASFETVVSYGGVPQTLPNGWGFIHTDDGSLVIGQPKVAATWFPVNDHPSDKASYTFRIRAPRSRAVVANGDLVGTRTANGWRTWLWEAVEPMAPYLATANVGRWRFFEGNHDGIEILDAIDTKLFRPLVRPRTGKRVAYSRDDDNGYRRLTRTITVPAKGARVAFSVNRQTQPFFDFFTVEARTVGQNDWTTLRDLNGHTERFVGAACPFWLETHPFLRHYMTPGEEEQPGNCEPRGSTGRWRAAHFPSRGYERWAVDLSRYAGSRVQLSLTTVTDKLSSYPGVFIDDVRVSTGEGTTSFEDDGNRLDGWRPAAPPPGSPPVDAGWASVTVAGVPSTGSIARSSLNHQGQIIDFLEGWFGPYPFSQAGGIVDRRHTGLALETQTRPVYDPRFFSDTVSGDAVVVHELAHQWAGDSLTVKRWRHIWLNEGFATYMEWVWSGQIGSDTPQQIFDSFYRFLPRRDSWWKVKIGNPGPTRVLDFPVYFRGAMTLHALRVIVGDDDFRTILRRWTTSQSGGLVTTGEFVRLAERVSGRSLDRFFKAWLFTPEKPPRPKAMGPMTVGDSTAAPGVFLDRLDSQPLAH